MFLLIFWQALERKARAEAKLAADIERWDPTKDPKVQSDPLKTLFVGRLVCCLQIMLEMGIHLNFFPQDYKTNEDRLREVFGTYGAIRTVRGVLIETLFYRMLVLIPTLI